MSSTGAYTEPAPQSKWRTGSKKEDHLQQVLAERASKEGLKRERVVSADDAAIQEMNSKVSNSMKRRREQHLLMQTVLLRLMI